MSECPKCFRGDYWEPPWQCGECERADEAWFPECDDVGAEEINAEFDEAFGALP